MPIYDFRCGKGHLFERFVALSEFAKPQSCECGASSQRVISAPAVHSDAIEPVRGADGKMHDSMASYRRSLAPGGNPQGERYIELGNEKVPDYKPPEFDPKARRDAIRAGIADVKAGRVPPVPATGIPT